MDEYEISVGVAGTHGKSTASGMLTHALIKAGCAPTAFLGAKLPEAGAAFTLGDRKWFVAESCEYCESFLYLYPKVAVILNVETDHLDYFSGLPHIISAFGKFALNTPADGTVVVNADSKNAMEAAGSVPRRIISFGVQNGDVQARDLFAFAGYYGYDLYYDNVRLGRIKLSVPGLHNVSNSLAVAAAMIAGNAKTKDILGGISDFSGMERRFQNLGRYNGATLIDDYAHHPDELRATLNTARSMGYSRIVCLFQPHTYSRTAALLDGFVSALGLADLAVLTDIYSAREKNTFGISSKTVSDRLPGSFYIPELSGAADFLAANIREGDLVLACGAGTVGSVLYDLLGRNGE